MNKETKKILSTAGGIRLDIACGASKQKGFVGMDMQALPGVDIVHDIASLPWPLPDECVIQAIGSHIIEHIPKVAVYLGKDGKFHTHTPLISFMNEIWRVMKPGGQLALALPHGYSPGFLQDPTHASGINETTWAYFDPDHPFYNFYRPRPWHRDFQNWDPSGNMEVVLSKIPQVNVPVLAPMPFWKRIFTWGNK